MNKIENISSKNETIIQAIKEKKKIQFNYHDIDRKVEAQCLFKTGKLYYFYGYCNFRNEVRTFSVSEIKNLSFTDERSIKPALPFDFFKYSQNLLAFFSNELTSIVDPKDHFEQFSFNEGSQYSMTLPLWESKLIDKDHNVHSENIPRFFQLIDQLDMEMIYILESKMNTHEFYNLINYIKVSKHYTFLLNQNNFSLIGLEKKQRHVSQIQTIIYKHFINNLDSDMYTVDYLEFLINDIGEKLSDEQKEDLYVNLYNKGYSKSFTNPLLKEDIELIGLRHHLFYNNIRMTNKEMGVILTSNKYSPELLNKILQSCHSALENVNFSILLVSLQKCDQAFNIPISIYKTLYEIVATQKLTNGDQKSYSYHMLLSAQSYTDLPKLLNEHGGVDFTLSNNLWQAYQYFKTEQLTSAMEIFKKSRYFNGIYWCYNKKINKE